MESVLVSAKRISIIGAGRDRTFVDSGVLFGFALRDGANVELTGIDITSPGSATPALSVGGAGTLDVTACRMRDSDGGGQAGGGLEAGLGTSVRFMDSEFSGNTGVSGAVFVYGGEVAHFIRCLFRENVANLSINDAGVATIVANDVLFKDCDFIENTSVAGFGGVVGAINFSGEAGGHLRVERCLFAGNEATDVGAIHVGYGGSAHIRNSTFVGNTGATIGAISVSGNAASTPTTLENCILTTNGPGPVLDCDGDALTVVCCDVWNNASGRACLPGDRNISLDPLFCGADLWSLQEGSPCAPHNSPSCGLIGAKDVACTSPTEQTSWGRIKSKMLRR